VLVINKTILILIPFLFIALANADTIAISNSSLSTLNTTGISPKIAYQLLNTTFSTTISSNDSITNATWYLNNAQIATQANINSTTYNSSVSYIFNTFGNYNLTLIAYDNSSNEVSDTLNLTVYPYTLPAIGNVNPSNVNLNTSTIFSVNIQAGSFPLSNITWDFDGNYITNIAQAGNNFQAYNFTTPYANQITVQACDINDFCSQSTTTVNVQTLTPSSYWTVNNAQLYKDIPYPDVAEVMTLQFIPYNDTNPLYIVSVNWGDGTVNQYIYNTTISSGQYETYQHIYTALGNYSINVETCDTQMICYNTFIANVSETQNIESLTSNLLIRQNPNIPSNAILADLLSAFQAQFGGVFGEIVFWLIIIIAIVIIAFISFVFIVNKVARAGRW
jgi:hypothetical protein